ncbi:hypothetical protein EXS73_01905 [Candidatus Pacearchaeota archaeon]|nr:hypothetical protein [Candidatus Pacearchaeota archaeon]
MLGSSSFLLTRYEGLGVWEVFMLPYGHSVSTGFTSFVSAHHRGQLSPGEEQLFQHLGLERGVFFHVLDLDRVARLN